MPALLCIIRRQGAVVKSSPPLPGTGVINAMAGVFELFVGPAVGALHQDAIPLAPVGGACEKEDDARGPTKVAEERYDQQPKHDPAGTPTTREGSEKRPWPVKMLTWLLLFQGVGLVFIGLFNVDLETGLQQVLVESSFFASLPALGLLALVAAAGFFRPRPGAWVMAMLVQGLALLITLLFYFRYRSENLFLYAIMIYAIIMVLYLNYAQVPVVFRGQPDLVAEMNDE